MDILIIFLIVLFSGFLFIYFEKINYKNKLLKMNLTRGEFTRENFINHFEKKGYNSKKISILYDEIVDYIKFPEFILLPEDDLQKICDFHDMDDIEFIDRICLKSGVSKPEQKVLDVVNNKYNLITFEYLLELTHK